MSTISRLRAKRIALSLQVATPLAVLLAVGMPTVAHAQEPKKDCEPGSWFCGETQPSGGKELQPLPAAPPPAETKPAERAAPPVVVYQPPPPTVVVQARDAPAAYYYVPRKAPPKKEWGLNLHLGGTMMGKGREGNAGLGMAGLGLRFRPIPQAALQGDLDFAGGRDYNGFKRSETAFTLNGLVFLNPKNVTQVYLLGGFGWSWANAVDDRGSYDIERNYAYFGAQAGVGLEFRLSRVIALNIDLRGLVRTRVDDGRRMNPEFISADGTRSTNTSGAGLLQAGLTFYW